MARRRADCESAAADEHRGPDDENRQQHEADSSALQQAMPQSQELGAKDGARRPLAAHATSRSMSFFDSGPAVSFRKSSSRLACSFPAWTRSSFMVPVAVMWPRSMMATRRHKA